MSDIAFFLVKKIAEKRLNSKHLNVNVFYLWIKNLFPFFPFAKMKVQTINTYFCYLSGIARNNVDPCVN